MYSTLKLVHAVCAVVTIGGFALRGYWMLVAPARLDLRITRITPHIVDSALLLSGLAMLVMLSLNPFTQTWMVAKLVGLVIYIGLGMLALRRGKTRRSRVIAFIAALLVVCYIAGVALSRSPASWLAIRAEYSAAVFHASQSDVRRTAKTARRHQQRSVLSSVLP